MLCDLWGIKDTFDKPTKPETTKETPKSATECTDTPNNTSSSPSVVAKKWTEIESCLHKINDMVRAFYLVRFAQLTYLINQSNWFALSFDESTSKVCSKSYLSIVIAYRDRAAHKNRNHFMKLKPLFGGDAATITQAILSFLNDDLGVDGDRFVCVTGDNCSTNTGSISGVFVRLIAVFTALFSMGCMAHRLALAISGALFLLSYFVALEKIIRRLITWARASPKRAGELTAAANEIEEKAKQVGVMHRIRWLSRENVSKT
eukprot:1073113_1